MTLISRFSKGDFRRINNFPVKMKQKIAFKSKVTVATLISSVVLMAVGFSVLILSDTANDLISDTYLLVPQTFGIWVFLALVLLVAPVFEEFFFRLWLKPKYLWGIALMILFLAFSLGIVSLGIGLVVLTFPIFFYYRKAQNYLKNNALSAVVTSALVFSVAHSSNFSELYFVHFWFFLILFGLGMILGLTRLRFGLWAAVLCHFIYNLLVTMPVMPDLRSTSVEFEQATLIEHGLFESESDVLAFDKQRCNRCDKRDLIFRVAYRVFPDALVKLDLDRNERPFETFSLGADKEVSYSEILNELTHHFSLKIEKAVEVTDEIQLNFFEKEEYAYTPENLVKHRPRSQGDFTSSSAKYFIEYIEKEYGVKVSCRTGCESSIVLAVQGGLSLEENLQHLSDKGLIEYCTTERECEVVIISSED